MIQIFKNSPTVERFIGWNIESSADILLSDLSFQDLAWQGTVTSFPLADYKF
jgi:hypothetical protein